MKDSYAVNGDEDIEPAMRALATWRFAIDLLEHNVPQEDLEYYSECLCKDYEISKANARKALLKKIKEFEKEQKAR